MIELIAALIFFGLCVIWNRSDLLNVTMKFVFGLMAAALAVKAAMIFGIVIKV